MECLGVGFRVDLHLVSRVHIGQIALIDVHEYPHLAHVRNRETLRDTVLQQLPRSDQTLYHFTPHRCQQRDFERRLAGVFRDRIGILDPQRPKCILAGDHVGFRLRTAGLGLLQLTFGYGSVRIQIFRAMKIFVGKLHRVFCLDIGGPRHRIIRAVHRKKRGACRHCLSWRNQDFMHRAAYRRKHRCGFELVIGDRPRQPKYPLESRLLDRCDLQVDHLLRRHRKQFGNFRFLRSVGRHFGFGLARTGMAAGNQQA